MSKKRFFPLISTLICFAFSSESSYALPQDPQIISGSAHIEKTDHVMEIRPSDQAILHYSKFNIGKGETVKFIQNSASSCVLNKVKGKDLSKIFGSLESNGKVFLVNSNGVYFGPESQVNVGSLIVSTLNLADQDFLAGKYEFHLQDEIASIQNEGSLMAEESIALISPHIQNKGMIQAKTAAAVLASGTHVTLDFIGDGLLRFSVEGSLKEALIENLGEIKGSMVSMKLPAAKKAISDIVNIDGAEIGEVFIEENGVIKLVSESSVTANQVFLEASTLEIEGKIDASNLLDQGGEIGLFGTNISLQGAYLDVSGALGGGTALIGGEYQGGGSTPYASTVSMDPSSLILGNAIEEGNGGLVVLWSQDYTLFGGQVQVKGGALKGNGGILETSSKNDLSSFGFVDTSSPMGELGTWLLDPANVTVNSSSRCISQCGTPCKCSSSSQSVDCSSTAGQNVSICSNYNAFTISGNPPLNVPACNANIVIQATYGIYVESTISIQKGSLTFSPCSDSPGGIVPVFFEEGSAIKTSGRSLTFSTGAVLVLQSDLVIDLTNDGNGGGSNLTLNQVQSTGTNAGFYGIEIKPGTGSTTQFSTVSNQTTVKQYNADGSELALLTTYPPNFVTLDGTVATFQTSEITTSGGGAINLNSQAVTLIGGGVVPLSTVIDGSTSGGTITTGTINASGSEGVTINAGTVGGISVGDIGGITPLASVTITGGNSSSRLPSAITTNNGKITLNKSFNLNQSLALTTGGGSVDASTSSLTTSSPITVTTSGGAVSLGTVQSSQPITITASGGDVNLGSNISAGTISVTGGSVTAATTKSTQSTTITASGGAINLGSTTSSGPIGISTTGSGTVTLTSTNSSGQLTLTTASGDINSGTIQSGQSTVITTTTGNVNLNTTTSSGALNITTSGGSASLNGPNQASGAINVTTGAGFATLGTINSAQSITVTTTSGNASLTGPTQTSGEITVMTGTGSATLGTTNSAQSITVTTSGGDVDLDTTTQISGAIDITTGGGSATLGTTNSAQSITVTTSGGDVDLDITTQILGPIAVTTGGGSATLGTTNSAQSITVTTSGGDVDLDITTQISGAIDITTGGGSATLGTTGLAQSITVTTSGGDASLDTTTQILGPIVVTTGGGSATLGTTDILGSITVTTEGGSATLTLTETPESITIMTAGGAVTLGSTQASQPFTISAGSGGISAGIVTMLTSFGTFTTSTGGSLNFQNITTESAAITISPVPIDLKTNGLLSSVISGSGAAITLSKVDGSLDSQGAEIAPSFTVNAGIGVLTVGTIGGSHPLGKITISAASDFALPSISTANQSIVINPSILLSQDAILTTIFGSGTGGSITLPSVNGSAHNLTLTAGNQFVQTGALSNLGAISISGATVTLIGAVTGESLTINNSGLLSLLSGSVSLSSIFSQTGTGETDLSQNISASSISFTGPLVLEAAVSLTATSSSFSAASVSGNFGLTVLASSDITIASLDVTATSLTSTTGSINITGSIVSGVSTLTASAGPISVGGDITVSSLTVIAEGNVSILGSIKFTENSSITSNSGQVLVGSVSSLSDFTVMANELISTGAISVSGLTLDSVASSISTGTLTVTSTATLTASTSITVTSIAASDGAMSAGTLITILGDAAIANQLNMTASGGAILIQGGVEAAVGDFEATEGITVSGALFKVDEATLLNAGGNISLPQVLSSVSFDATANGGSFSSGIFNAGEATFDIFGSMTVNGTVFVDLTFTVTNVNGLTITGITNVDQLILGDGPGNLSGTMVFQGPVTIQQLTTVAQNYGVSFLNGGEIFSATTFNNTGEVTLQSGTNGILVFDGAVISNATPTTVLGQIATTVGGMTFQSLNVLAGGSSLITAGGGIKVVGATALNGNASFVTLGGDLTFDLTVEGPGGLLVSTFPGVVTFDQTIGFGTALAYLTAVDIGRVETKGVKAIGTINMGSPIILTNVGNNIFQSEGFIALGDIDGTTSGFQDLTILAGTGGVNLGNVGQIIPIDTFLISTGTQALIKSIQTEGTIEIDINTVLAETQGGVITLNTNGGTSLGADITLNLIDGSTLGQQGLILNGGSLGDVFLQKNVGSSVPIASLEVRGASLSIEGALMSITGNQNYYPPTVIYPNLAVFTTFGNVTFYSSLDMTSDLASLIFYMGGGSFTLLGNTGNSHMGNLSVLNSGAFSSQEITANSLRVGGGRSIITLNSTVELSGLAGIVLDGGPIFLGGEIDAMHLFFRSSGAMSNLSSPQPINIDSSAPFVFEYFNALGGNVGTFDNPIQINTVQALNVGANRRADFIGTPSKSRVFPILSNYPCIVTFNGVTIIDCTTQPTTASIFNTIPKNLLYVPGIYSSWSWDNLSSDWYFEESPFYLGENPRDQKLFYLPKKRKEKKVQFAS